MFVFKQNTKGLIHCGFTTALYARNPGQAALGHAQSQSALNVKVSIRERLGPCKPPAGTGGPRRF